MQISEGSEEKRTLDRWCVRSRIKMSRGGDLDEVFWGLEEQEGEIDVFGLGLPPPRLLYSVSDLVRWAVRLGPARTKLRFLGGDQPPRWWSWYKRAVRPDDHIPVVVMLAVAFCITWWFASESATGRGTAGCAITHRFPSRKNQDTGTWYAKLRRYQCSLSWLLAWIMWFS
jgi:hypothetical protein